MSGSTLFGQFNNPGQPWPGPSVQTEVPISTGVWNDVAWTYDQSAMRLYWNGSLVATHLIGANAIAQSSSNFQIGGVDNPKVYFSGLIDEVSVYNVALSAANPDFFEAAHAGKCFAPVLPYFQIEPADQTVNAGQTVNFTASAGGTPPLAYQWQFDGTNLAGATTTLLMLANVQAGQAGVYSMVVSNAAGRSQAPMRRGWLIPHRPARRCPPVWSVGGADKEISPTTWGLMMAPCKAASLSWPAKWGRPFSSMVSVAP